jgi:uncharacterized SAM-binding protein YcdF (DUF218 family)
MFFALSKTLNYLTMPLTIVVVCLAVSVFIRNAKWKKRTFRTGLVLLLFFTNEFIANGVMRVWEIQATPFNQVRKYRIGIVLTGATIDKVDPDDRIYFQRGADRVYHSVQLYKLNRLEKILISGGTGRLVGQNKPEADKFREAMIIMGVPDSVIMVENKTRNTHESAVAVKDVLQSLNYESVDCLLITSAFHMRRSLACFYKAGLHPDSFTTDFYSHPADYHLDTLLVPQLDAMIVWHKLIKEWAGMIAYKLAGYI